MVGSFLQGKSQFDECPFPSSTVIHDLYQSPLISPLSSTCTCPLGSFVKHHRWQSVAVKVAQQSLSHAQADLRIRSSPLRRSRAICLRIESLLHVQGELSGPKDYAYTQEAQKRITKCAIITKQYVGIIQLDNTRKDCILNWCLRKLELIIEI